MGVPDCMGVHHSGAWASRETRHFEPSIRSIHHYAANPRRGELGHVALQETAHPPRAAFRSRGPKGRGGPPLDSASPSRTMDYAHANEHPLARPPRLPCFYPSIYSFSMQDIVALVWRYWLHPSPAFRTCLPAIACRLSWTSSDPTSGGFSLSTSLHCIPY